MLKVLQSMTQVPFADLLVLQKSPAVVDNDDEEVGAEAEAEAQAGAEAEAEVEALPEAVRAALKDDPSQLAAVEYALRHNVSLIQGPPGTGKSFVGVQIAKALIDRGVQAGRPERILCLCYTNHALDDFLETLVDHGVPLEGVVRLGRSPKISERMKPCCLENVRRNATFDGPQSHRRRVLKDQKEKAESEMESWKRTWAASSGVRDVGIQLGHSWKANIQISMRSFSPRLKTHGCRCRRRYRCHLRRKSPKTKKEAAR